MKGSAYTPSLKTKPWRSGLGPVAVTCEECQRKILLVDLLEHRKDHVALKVLQLSIEERPTTRAALYERRLEVWKNILAHVKAKRQRQNARGKTQRGHPRIITKIYKDQVHLNARFLRKFSELSKATFQLDFNLQDDTDDEPRSRPRLQHFKLIEGLEYEKPRAGSQVLFQRQNSWCAVSGYCHRFRIDRTTSSGGSFHQRASHLSYAVLCEGYNGSMACSKVAAYLPMYLQQRYENISGQQSEHPDPRTGEQTEARANTENASDADHERRVHSTMRKAFADAETLARTSFEECAEESVISPSGCTCVCCMVDVKSDLLCVGNIGTCAALQFQIKKVYSQERPRVAVKFREELSEDHSVKNPSELQRLRKSKRIKLADDPKGRRDWRQDMIRRGNAAREWVDASFRTRFGPPIDYDDEEIPFDDDFNLVTSISDVRVGDVDWCAGLDKPPAAFHGDSFPVFHVRPMAYFPPQPFHKPGFDGDVHAECRRWHLIRQQFGDYDSYAASKQVQRSIDEKKQYSVKKKGDIDSTPAACDKENTPTTDKTSSNSSSSSVSGSDGSSILVNDGSDGNAGRVNEHDNSSSNNTLSTDRNSLRRDGSSSGEENSLDSSRLDLMMAEAISQHEEVSAGGNHGPQSDCTTPVSSRPDASIESKRESNSTPTNQDGGEPSYDSQPEPINHQDDYLENALDQIEEGDADDCKPSIVQESVLSNTGEAEEETTQNDTTASSCDLPSSIQEDESSRNEEHVAKSTDEIEAWDSSVSKSAFREYNVSPSGFLRLYSLFRDSRSISTFLDDYEDILSGDGDDDVFSSACFSQHAFERYLKDNGPQFIEHNASLHLDIKFKLRKRAEIEARGQRRRIRALKKKTQIEDATAESSDSQKGASGEHKDVIPNLSPLKQDSTSSNRVSTASAPQSAAKEFKTTFMSFLQDVYALCHGSRTFSEFIEEYEDLMQGSDGENEVFQLTSPTVNKLLSNVSTPSLYEGMASENNATVSATINKNRATKVAKIKKRSVAVEAKPSSNQPAKITSDNNSVNNSINKTLPKLKPPPKLKLSILQEEIQEALLREPHEEEVEPVSDSDHSEDEDWMHTPHVSGLRYTARILGYIGNTLPYKEVVISIPAVSIYEAVATKKGIERARALQAEQATPRQVFTFSSPPKSIASHRLPLPVARSRVAAVDIATGQTIQTPFAKMPSVHKPPRDDSSDEPGTVIYDPDKVCDAPVRESTSVGSGSSSSVFPVFSYSESFPGHRVNALVNCFQFSNGSRLESSSISMTESLSVDSRSSRGESSVSLTGSCFLDDSSDRIAHSNGSVTDSVSLEGNSDLVEQEESKETTRTTTPCELESSMDSYSAPSISTVSTLSSDVFESAACAFTPSYETRDETTLDSSNSTTTSTANSLDSATSTSTPSAETNGVDDLLYSVKRRFRSSHSTGESLLSIPVYADSSDYMADSEASSTMSNTPSGLSPSPEMYGHSPQLPVPSNARKTRAKLKHVTKPSMMTDTTTPSPVGPQRRKPFASRHNKKKNKASCGSSQRAGIVSDQVESSPDPEQASKARAHQIKHETPQERFQRIRREVLAFSHFQISTAVLLIPGEAHLNLKGEQFAEILSQLINRAVVDLAYDEKLCERTVKRCGAESETTAHTDELARLPHDVVTSAPSGGRTRATVQPPDLQVHIGAMPEDPAGPCASKYDHECRETASIVSKSTWVMQQVAKNMPLALLESGYVKNANVVLLFR
eukprot:scpid6213/ scgid33756/ 